LQIVVDIRLKGRIIDVIGSAVANLLNRRLSTNLYNHVADLGYRNRPSEDIPAELSSLNSRDSNAQSALQCSALEAVLINQYKGIHHA